MARIPLAEIPNAPSGGSPYSLANPRFPQDEVGNQAISQIREAYRSNLVDVNAATAMSRAGVSIGTNITQIGMEGMDAIVSYSKMADAQATSTFLTNLTEVQGAMKQQMAATDPSMFPVVVKNTYRDKNGNLNPALFKGISNFSRRFVEADALRSEAKDMAESSLTAHIAHLEQDEGKKLAAMQTLITSGGYDDATTLNDSMFKARQLTPAQFANNKAQIDGARDNALLLSSISDNPSVMMQRLTKAYTEGKPIPELQNISVESYPKYIKTAEVVQSMQATEKIGTLTQLVDTKKLLDLPALRTHPLYNELNGEMQRALERRITNASAGTPQSEAFIKQGFNKLSAFPATDAPAREMMELVTWATANIPDPFLEPFTKRLNEKVAEMAANGGVLSPNSKLESYVANKLDTLASAGVFGMMPNKQSGNAQSMEYAQGINAIETAKMNILEKFRAAGIKNQADADEFVAQHTLTAQAKNAFKNDPDFGTRLKQFLFGKPDPNAPATPKPAKTPDPTPQGSPVGNETSMFDPDVNDLVAGAYTFKVTDQTRDALPASTPTARQVSLDFNDASSPTARGVEIIIPNDATEEERAIAKAYVDRTTEWFRSKGIDVPNRGVRTAKENGRGTRGRFHTEPFFVGDADALAAMQSDPQGYAQVLASTLGRIEGVTFIAPHKATDPGASRGKLNERDFAKSVIIPELRKLVNA